MTTRLDTQRAPSKVHTRKNSRWYTRGYDNVDHPVWGDTPVVSVPGGYARIATAGDRRGRSRLLVRRSQPASKR